MLDEEAMAHESEAEKLRLAEGVFSTLLSRCGRNTAARSGGAGAGG
jgi:hypothetical protein